MVGCRPGWDGVQYPPVHTRVEDGAGWARLLYLLANAETRSSLSKTSLLYLLESSETEVGHYRLGCSTCWHMQSLELGLGLIGKSRGYLCLATPPIVTVRAGTRCRPVWWRVRLVVSHVKLDHRTPWLGLKIYLAGQRCVLLCYAYQW